MKDWNLEKIIRFALGITSGFIIYDVLFHDNVDWIRAVFVGVFVAIIFFIIKKVSANKN